MLLAVVVQTVISGPVGGTPMPEMMMSAVRPLRVRVALQSWVFKTSPLEMVRWVSSADCGTPFSRRRAVSLDGVRTTDGDFSWWVGSGEKGCLRAVQS